MKLHLGNTTLTATRGQDNETPYRETHLGATTELSWQEDPTPTAGHITLRA